MRNNNGDGCLGYIVLIVIVVLLSLIIQHIEVVAIILGIIVLIAVIFALIKFSLKKVKKRNIDKTKERKEYLINELTGVISHKKEIIQIFDRHFDEIERQFSLVSLISSCMGSNVGLKEYFINSKEGNFLNLKKEVYDKFSKKEKKSFPEDVGSVAKYKKSLDEELIELQKDMDSIECSNEEQLLFMMRKYCPKQFRKIKRKKVKVITSIVTATVAVVSVLVLLSSNFAFDLAKGYHKSVIEEHLLDEDVSMCSFDLVQYEEQYKHYYDEENVTNYDIKKIELKYNGCFSQNTEEEIEMLLRNLYRELNINITYQWAHHHLAFDVSRYYEIVLRDSEGLECGYNGSYFDINRE